MSVPRLEINLDAIRDNARKIVEIAGANHCQVAGVTKSCGGDPLIARAMLAGGVSALADSRLENIERLRSAGIEADFMLLRSPMLSMAGPVVELVDVSLNADIQVITELGRQAVARGRTHRVILMVDVGDLREGVLPAAVLDFTRRVLDLPGISLEGLGTNLACYAGVAPTPEKMLVLINLRQAVWEATGVRLPVLSGGNSANLKMLWQGQMPLGINWLRVGEGILMGRETIGRENLPGLDTHTFTLVAEVIEIAEKPSVPEGPLGEDAFGRKPVFVDKGVRRRALVALGRQDADPATLYPAHPGVSVLGASSDHLLLDITDSGEEWYIGREVVFKLGYSTLMLAMMSPYVTKCYIGCAAYSRYSDYCNDGITRLRSTGAGSPTTVRREQNCAITGISPVGLTSSPRIGWIGTGS